jgi:hypothetical protein
VSVLVFFQLHTERVLGDEYAYRWPVQRLAGGHGLHLWPGVLPLALPQIFTALPMALAGQPASWLRLTTLPYLAVAAVLVAALGRRIGAAPWWAAVAAVTFIAAPLTLSVGSGLTSDICYVALLLACCWFAFDWLDRARGMLPLVLLTGLAMLERQHALLIAFCFTAVLPFAWRARPRAPGELLWLALLWIVEAAALGAPFALHLASNTMTNVSTGRGTLHIAVAPLVGGAVELAPLLGLVFLPLAPALVLSPRAPGRHRSELVAVGVGVAGLTAAAVFAFHFGTMIFPGNVFGNWGLGPLHLPGDKPPLIPLPIFLVLELLTCMSLAVLLLQRRADWSLPALSLNDRFLVLLALSHIAPMAVTAPLDRYYLPVFALLAPLLARMAQPRRAAKFAAAAALFLVGLGVAYYASGEQDYQAWQEARHKTADVAYRGADPLKVAAGYEEVGVRIVLPAYEASGRIVMDPVNFVPAKPDVLLVFAPADDPRPGVRYQSLAPGKVVIVRVTR